MGKLLEMPRKTLSETLPGWAKCTCGEILVDHRDFKCPVIVGNIIVGFSAVRTFRTADHQGLPYV